MSFRVSYFSGVILRGYCLGDSTECEPTHTNTAAVEKPSFLQLRCEKLN